MSSTAYSYINGTFWLGVWTYVFFNAGNYIFFDCADLWLSFGSIVGIPVLLGSMTLMVVCGISVAKDLSSESPDRTMHFGWAANGLVALIGFFGAFALAKIVAPGTSCWGA